MCDDIVDEASMGDKCSYCMPETRNYDGQTCSYCGNSLESDVFDSGQIACKCDAKGNILFHETTSPAEHHTGIDTFSENTQFVLWTICLFIMLQYLQTLPLVDIRSSVDSFNILWIFILVTNNQNVNNTLCSGFDVNQTADAPDPGHEKLESGVLGSLEIGKGCAGNNTESVEHSGDNTPNKFEFLLKGQDASAQSDDIGSLKTYDKNGIFKLRSVCVSNRLSIVYPVFKSLDTFLSRVQNTGRISQEDEMCYEVRRFQSFNSVPVRASPMRLTQSGFYATGTGDETRCYSCRETYRDWRLMDQPNQIHRSISPDCPHLNRRDERNIPLCSSDNNSVTTVFGVLGEYPLTNGSTETTPGAASQPSLSGTVTATTNNSESTTPSAEAAALTGLDISKSVYPQYRELSSRLNSYEGWGFSHIQDPQVLARAGFYYAGYRDCVRCFYCGVGLRTWEKEDDPWVEHVRWRSSCDYIRVTKGEQFVIQALTRQDSRVAAPLPTTRVNSQTHATRLHATHGGIDAVAKAEEMGFARNQIDRAVQELTASRAARETTRDTIQLEALLERLVLMSEEPVISHISSSVTSPSRDIPAHQGEPQTLAPTSSTSYSFAGLSHVTNSNAVTSSRRASDTLTLQGSKDDSYTGASDDMASTEEPWSRQSIPAGNTSMTSQKTSEQSATGVESKTGKKSTNKKKKKNSEVSEVNKETSGFDDTKVLSVSEERQLEEENQSMRDESTCKICMDNPSCIVFLPCGHLVTCAECAPALRKCPICRAVIRGTVRAHTVSSEDVNLSL